MVRQVIAALGALTLSAALASAPPAAAAGAGQIITTQGGAVRCLVSADLVEQGGGPTVICGQTSGAPWGPAMFSNTKPNPWLNLALLRGSGQFVWILGDTPGAGQTGINVAEGQTVQTNGWTIHDEGLRTAITYDGNGHGMYVNTAQIRFY